MENSRDFEKVRILALTGRAAEKIVRKNCPKNVTVKVLPIDVAAFINKEIISENLSQAEAANFDLILVPGFTKGDLRELSEKYGVPIVKGPKYATDIKFAIIDNNPFDLSSKKSADAILKEKKFLNSKKILQEGFSLKIDRTMGEFYLGMGKVSNGKYSIGLNHPPLVMAEIVDATLLSIDEVINRTNYYLQNNVDILDIGCSVKSSEPEKVKEIILEIAKLQKSHTFCISIDSLDVREILAAVDVGVDLVLSVDKGNIDSLINVLPKDIGLVIIPTNTKKGFIPSTAEARVHSLKKLQNQLNSAGYQKIFVDPIIEIPIHPGFIRSLEGYLLFRKEDKKTPMMCCVGNVTEFIEADPVGINALFGCIAAELGIQLLLATDVSTKCRGGVGEIVKARNLAFVSKMRETPPKDHGIDILLAKSRTGDDLELPFDDTISIVEFKERNMELYPQNYDLDPKGNFTIWINYHQQKIFVLHSESNENNPNVLFISKSARDILDQILKRHLISKIDHAIYLGRELERAEVCLFLGKTYIQNEQTFKEIDIE